VRAVRGIIGKMEQESQHRQPITVGGALSASRELALGWAIEGLRPSAWFAQPHGWNEIVHWTSLPVRMAFYPAVLIVGGVLGLAAALVLWALVLLLSPVILYIGHRQRKALRASSKSRP